jgi:hypothetical protein
MPLVDVQTLDVSVCKSDVGALVVSDMRQSITASMLWDVMLHVTAGVCHSITTIGVF